MCFSHFRMVPARIPQSMTNETPSHSFILVQAMNAREEFPMDLRDWKVFRDLDGSFLDEIKIAITCGFDNETEEQMAGVMVTQDDQVYSVGTNLFGCLARRDRDFNYSGNFFKVDRCTLPVKIPSLCKRGITKLAAGYGHVLALTSEGQLYGWGDNKFCQVGLKSITQPTQITASDPGKIICDPTVVSGDLDGKAVTDVACGFNHTLALTSDGNLYGWGYNKHGRVGVKTDALIIVSPTKIIFPGKDTKIKSMSCGRHFSVALSQNGTVYAWGSNACSQIGTSEPYNVSSPQKISIPGTSSPIKSIACGAFHTLALSANNECFIWGLDRHTIFPPRKISPVHCGSAQTVEEIAASFLVTLSAIRTSSGLVYTKGEYLGEEQTVIQKTHFQSTDHAFAYCPRSPVMWRQIVFEKRGPRVADAWLAALENEENCDIEFHVEGSIIRAHRFFLQTRSEYFLRRLTGPWSESCSNGIVPIEDCSMEMFLKFLRYLYSDRIEAESTSDLFELLEMADYYGEPDLQNRCQFLLKAAVCVQNASEFYLLTSQCNAKDLESYVRNFVRENYAAITQTESFDQLDGKSRQVIIQAAGTAYN